jgi:hypothetical protein
MIRHLPHEQQLTVRLEEENRKLEAQSFTYQLMQPDIHVPTRSSYRKNTFRWAAREAIDGESSPVGISFDSFNDIEFIYLCPMPVHEGNTMRKIMGNKSQVSSDIINHSPLRISWNDHLHQGQTADVSIIRAKTGTFSIETLDVHLAP